MVTQKNFKTEDIQKENEAFSPLKSIIETAFYGNNVLGMDTLAEAYQRALHAPQTIVLDQEVAHADELGLPEGAKVLVHNGGSIVGRTARARKIYGAHPIEDKKLLKLAMDAVYDGSFSPFLKGEAVVGLEEEFMVRAHLMLPEEYSTSMYSWLINFQIMNEVYRKRYAASKAYEENDIYIYANPNWSNDAYPNGLAYFDTTHNVAIILGLEYFGELKKGTLTLAWGTAARQGYVASHGGLKEFTTEDGHKHVASFYGLSGSGKSTLTHAKHSNKYGITVLHDDAFIINEETGASIALEPAYFDKTTDYTVGNPEQEYFVTVQNTGVTLNEANQRVLLTEDIRNKNGRTVKSRYSTPNRVDRIDTPIDAIYWIMKDETLPPILRVKNSALASAMGCTLVTTRSSAENVENIGEVVVEPYANPFRVYPLVDDYLAFKALFSKGVTCYIINTGHFLNKNITPDVTLQVIEENVDKIAQYEQFGSVEDLEYVPVKGFEVPFHDEAYKQKLRANMITRMNHVKITLAEAEAPSKLPDEIIESIQRIVDQIN